MTRVGVGIGEVDIIDQDFAFSIYVSLTLIKRYGIKPHLRSHFNGAIVGYGVIDIPKKTVFRSQLESIID